MNDECVRLLTLSGRVVMLTEIERGELQLHPVRMAILPLFNDLVTKFQLKASKPVEFDVVCSEDLRVTADPFCLQEVQSGGQCLEVFRKGSAHPAFGRSCCRWCPANKGRR